MRVAMISANHNNKVIFAGNAVYLGHPLDLHEIFDDAANHGALDVDQNNACNHLHNLLWVVAGGPPVRPPPSLTITTTSGIANHFLTKSLLIYEHVHLMIFQYP